MTVPMPSSAAASKTSSRIRRIDDGGVSRRRRHARGRERAPVLGGALLKGIGLDQRVADLGDARDRALEVFLDGIPNGIELN